MSSFNYSSYNYRASGGNVPFRGGTRPALPEWCKTSHVWKCHAPPLNRPKRYQTAMFMKRMSTTELKEHLTVKKEITGLAKTLPLLGDWTQAGHAKARHSTPTLLAKRRSPLAVAHNNTRSFWSEPVDGVGCVQEMAGLYPQENGISPSALPEHTQPPTHSEAHYNQANNHSFYCSG